MARRGEGQEGGRNPTTRSACALVQQRANVCRVISGLTCATDTALPPYAERMFCHWNAP